MSDSWSGSMRGPRVKTPVLLLLLLLLSALSGTVLCQDYDAGAGEEAAPEVPGEENPDEEAPESSDDLGTIPTMVSTDGIAVQTDLGEEPFLDENTTATDDGSGETTDSPYSAEDTTPSPDEGLSPIIILIPVVLVVLIIGMIVCGIFINRRWNKKAINQELGKEDPYLDGSSTEKVPMPMFEEDVPSVLELEMEELDQWMKKDG